MPVAPQSTGSAISLTGKPYFEVFGSESVAIDPLQGAHLSRSCGLGVDRGFIPRPCICPHLEHLDPVAEAAGENKSYL